VEDSTAGGPLAGLHGFSPVLTSFIGRHSEVNEVDSLLGEYRLVTVIGPGGVGKSRLSTEVARRVAGRFADGVWLVELAAVSDPALVASAVAAMVGAQQTRRAPVIESLAEGLARRQLLLVLDNCEHVLGAVADLCGTLLAAADDLRILATSREPTGLPGETRYRLQPLAVPARGSSGAGEDGTAVALFADRARQADAHFTLDEQSAMAVAELVRRLDGMPLAIELAAARIEALGLGELASRLDDRVTLLASAGRGTAARHRSLESTMDWSYQLLTDQEQRVFRALAAFPGPFTLDAARTVAGSDAGPAVLRLVDCSLLTPPRPGADQQARYLMLQTLRVFAMSLLTEAGEEALAAEALADFAVQVAEQAAAELETSPGEVAAARRLAAEEPTLLQGLSWALEHDRDRALRLAIALAPWWAQTGRENAGYKMLDTAARQAASSDDTWAAAQYWLGPLADGTGDMARSRDHYTAARDALAGDTRSPLLCRAWAGRAESLMMLGQFDDAATEASRALALARELGDPVGEAHALACLAWTATYLGDYEGCLAWLQQTRQIDPARIPGRRIRAISQARAAALIETGQIAEARQECVHGMAQAREAGDIPVEADLLLILADAGLREGRPDDSAGHLREAIDLVSQVTGAVFVQLNCLDVCALLCVATGRLADAMTVWAASSAVLQQFGITDSSAMSQKRQESQQDASRALGPANVRAAEQRGAAMGLPAAMEFAGMLAAGPQQPSQAPGLTQLSSREQELVTLVARGSTDAQIAAQLYISISTVRSHLDRIRDKTGSRRRADLTRLALQTGLV
jgi:predicted ATPase/DNA-binding CsgD family transcriptional regulator